MSAQNFVALGLDISDFNEAKMEILNKYIATFDKLSKYDGLRISPSSGEGLATFNSALQQSAKLLEDMNSRIAGLTTVQNTLNSSTTNLTQNNTALGLSVKAYNADATQQANLQSKLAVSTSDQAKQTAILKVALQEATRQNIEDAKSTNTTIIARENAKKKTEEYRQEQMRVVETLRLLAKEQDKAAKNENAAKIKAERDEKARLRKEEIDLANAKKEVARVAKENEKAALNEAKAQRQLGNELTDLKNKMREQGERYALLYNIKGKDHPETAAALQDYVGTAKNLTAIETSLDNASGRANSFAGGLGKAFGTIRTIAYILPGIGIAGIFNLAFEAIEACVKELSNMDDGVLAVSKRQQEVNNHLLTQLNIYKDIYEQGEKLKNITDPTRTAALVRAAEAQKALGVDKVTTSQTDVNVASNALFEAANKVEIRGDITQTVKEIQDLISKQTKDAAFLLELNRRLDAKDEKTTSEKALYVAQLLANVNAPTAKTMMESKKINGVYTFNSEEELKQIAETAKTEIDVAKQKNEEKLANLTDYVSKSSELIRAQAAQQKLLSDEDRKLYVETNKDNIQVTIEKNNAVLSDERSTRDERLKLIDSISEKQKELNRLQRVSVTGEKKSLSATNDLYKGDTKDNPNLSATPAEIKIAENKQIADNVKADSKAYQDKEKVYIEFYQRYIKAKTEILKNETEKEAIANERIYKNDEKSLGERLIAYSNYIKAKQKLQDLELGKDLQRGAKGPGEKTSLTREEKVELTTATTTQKSNIQADTEKQVYDIVKTSLDKKLELIKTTNIIENKTNDEEYARELNKLNGQFEKKIFKYKEYAEERKKIDEKYRVGGLDEDISKDQDKVVKLKQFLDEASKAQIANNEEVDAAQKALDDKKAYGGDTLAEEFRLSQAIGRQKAYNDEILQAQKQLEEAKAKLDADEVKRAQKKYDDLKKKADDYAKFMQLLWDTIANIEKQIYEFIKKTVDNQYQERIRKVQEETKLYDSVADAEIASVERSTLSLKDKAALQAQLTEEKHVRDVNAAAEEKRLRREQAEFDKAATVAQIAIKTALAVVQQLTTGDPYTATARALAVGAIGATELALAAATPIPSYAEGAGKDVGKPPHPGGKARFGEAGWEKVKEPYKSPYFVIGERIAELPAGTELTPMTDYPDVVEQRKDESWDQIKFLAKVLKPKNQTKKTVNIINIKLPNQDYKRKILGY